MPPAPRVSVCMPAHRDHPWFARALDSVLAQTLGDLEVLVADDGGHALARRVAAAGDARARHLPNPDRLGFAGNHCRAIAAARGTYVAFLHDDDSWEPEYLAAAVAVLDRDPAIGVVLSGVTEVDAQGRVLGRRPARIPDGPLADPLTRFLRRDFMMLLPSASVFRRAALEANRRPWPDVIAADLTMYVDAVRAGWGVHHLDRPLVRYRTHAGQIGTDDLAHRHALVTVWGSYRFPEARLERLRRARLAGALVARAGARLRRGEAAQSRADLVAAWRAAPGALRGKGAALLAASLAPAACVPLALRGWHRLRDPVGARHRG